MSRWQPDSGHAGGDEAVDYPEDFDPGRRRESLATVMGNGRGSRASAPDGSSSTASEAALDSSALMMQRRSSGRGPDHVGAAGAAAAEGGPSGIERQRARAKSSRPSAGGKDASATADSTFHKSMQISLHEPVGSMSTSPANRDVVLGARKGLFVLDLENPYEPPRFLAHLTTWEVADIQWNPHPARAQWVASTSGQRLLIWNLDRPSNPRHRLDGGSSTDHLAAGSSVAHSVSLRYGPGSERPSIQSRTSSKGAGLLAGSQASRPSTSSLQQLNKRQPPTTPSGHSSAASSQRHMQASLQPLHRPPLRRNRTSENANISYLSGVSTSWTQERISSTVQQRRITPISHIFQHHTRAITDINWSPFEPDITASCGIDTWTWVWDLRTCSTGDAEMGVSLSGKPVQGYAAWNSSCQQVKWNRASPYRLATAVDNKVLVWDSRKGALPLCAIEAHESHIYSIDWSRNLDTGSDRLLTCSLDGTVKFWDLADERAQLKIGRRELVTEAEAVIETPTPVWRSRHLPFGSGVMTVPQRGDFGLSVWSREEALDRAKRPEAEARGPMMPVHRFEGHTDIVKEYLFRTRGGGDASCDDREWQLLTWGKDQTLRLWPISESLTKSVGHKPGQPIRVRMTRKNAKNVSYRIPPCEQELAESEGMPSASTSLNASSISTSQGVRSFGSPEISITQFPPSSSFTAPGSLTRGVLRPPNASSSMLSPSSTSPVDARARRVGMSAMRPAAGAGDRSTNTIRRAVISAPEQSKRAKPKRMAKSSAGGFMTVGGGYGPFRYNRGQGAAADPLGWIAGVKEATPDQEYDSDPMNAEHSTEEQEEETGKDARSLSDEIMSLSKKLPRVTFEKVEIAQRTCEIALYGPWGGREPIYIRVSFTFPAAYPNKPVEYSVERSAKINLKTRAFILRNLARLSREHAKSGESSLEACTRFLLGESNTLRAATTPLAEDDEESSDEDVSVPQAPPSIERPKAPPGEDRFLTSYDALAGAMADLAMKSAEGRAGQTDSDVLQLMSSNFIQRRL